MKRIECQVRPSNLDSDLRFRKPFPKMEKGERRKELRDSLDSRDVLQEVLLFTFSNHLHFPYVSSLCFSLSRLSCSWLPTKCTISRIAGSEPSATLRRRTAVSASRSRAAKQKSFGLQLLQVSVLNLQRIDLAMEFCAIQVGMQTPSRKQIKTKAHSVCLENVCHPAALGCLGPTAGCAAAIESIAFGVLDGLGPKC